jgi:hypothetical protein
MEAFMEFKNFPRKIVLSLLLDELDYTKLSDQDWSSLYELLDFVNGSKIEDFEFDKAVKETRKYIMETYCLFNLCSDRNISNQSLYSKEKMVAIAKPCKQYRSLKERKKYFPKQKMNV